MSGQLVGEVISAAVQLQDRGLTARGFQALIAIAEKCHSDTRQGTVPWSWIRQCQFGSSLSTAKRGVRSCKEIRAVRVVKRGFDNQNGRSCAPIYELLPLTEQVTQVNHSVGDRTGHSDEPFAPDRTGQIGDRTGQIEDRTGHPGDLLNGSINGSLNGGAPRHPNEPEPVEPSRYCQRHPEGTSDRCRDCGTARVVHERWTTELAEHRRQVADAERAAVAACPLCDDHRWRLGPDGTPIEPATICDHEPDQ